MSCSTPRRGPSSRPGLSTLSLRWGCAREGTCWLLLGAIGLVSGDVAACCRCGVGSGCVWLTWAWRGRGWPEQEARAREFDERDRARQQTIAELERNLKALFAADERCRELERHAQASRQHAGRAQPDWRAQARGVSASRSARKPTSCLPAAAASCLSAPCRLAAAGASAAGCGADDRWNVGVRGWTHVVCACDEHSCVRAGPLRDGLLGSDAGGRTG